ncbi:hypothetical protein VP01_218g1 [Puccinia sorghi]|uniref:Uncharacterized protein n=1 Tax=Puccinia sorghi TaxID=27349 RepID=A0A0L6V969_9BASI|nr:hypothetical protein VP01_218g1 [Puccinia sorghi]
METIFTPSKLESLACKKFRCIFWQSNSWNLDIPMVNGTSSLILGGRSTRSPRRASTNNKLKRRTEVKSNKPCGQSFWMCMPSIGEPLANVFQSPLFVFSSAESQKFLPHFFPANNNSPIFIAFRQYQF